MKLKAALSLFLSAALLILVILGLLVIRSVKSPSSGTATDKINVIVSIPPLQEFVEKIGGDRVAVSVMVKSGASPHTYEPTPGQLTALGTADMYVKVGTPIEFEITWLSKIESINKGLPIINSSRGIEPSSDPHIWLSPENAQAMVDNIYRGLINIDPKNQAHYLENKNSYLEQLTALDQQINKSLAVKKNRRFIVLHPAWGHFARQYNLQSLAIEADGKAPTARRLQELINTASVNNINIIFASPQFSVKSAEVIANEINGQVLLIDPLEKNYQDNMKKVQQALVVALK